MKSHRVWFKILFNPILRKFGYCIVSVVDINRNKVIRYELRRYPENCPVINL